MKRKNVGKTISLVLVLALVLAALPGAVFAEDAVVVPVGDNDTIADISGNDDIAGDEGPSDNNDLAENDEDSDTCETELDEPDELTPMLAYDSDGTTIVPFSTAAVIATAINNYNTSNGGTISATDSGNTVTVTGSLTSTTAPGLSLNIDPGVTVNWGASLSVTIASAGSITGYALTLTGTGTFNVNSGGITNNGTGGAISVSGSALGINGGAVNSPGSGIAIFNDGVAPSAISISGGTVTAGNSSAIQANSRGTIVTVSGGTVTNAATSNINPTINMAFIPTASQTNNTNVVVSGGLVQTTNPSNTSYVIQTAQNVTISGSAQVKALAGRAINLIGINSIATVSGNAVVSAESGIAISTATTNVNTVPNAQIIVNGGQVSTVTGTAAIQTTGTNGRVTVTGGQVTATSGVAIKATSNVVVSGGFVFAYGTNTGQVVSAPNTNFPTGGVVAAWNNATLNPLYVEGSANDLVILPANPASSPNNAYWHNNGNAVDGNGIAYNIGGPPGFFPLPVQVSNLMAGTQGLIFDIASGRFYLGTISTDTIYGEQSGNWSWNSSTQTLILEGFSWSTTAPIALTITGGNNINIVLNGSNTFVTTNTVPGGAGILSGASISIVQASTGMPGIPVTTGTPVTPGTLNASASAGLGIDCGANNLTMNGGTVNASAGNGTNTHGLNAGTLTINGGALNASSGGPATTGAFFGINAARLVVTDGDGIVTASGNSRAINNAALTLPAGYQYSRGTKADGSNASTFLVPNDAAYTYSANNSFVQIKALTPHDLTVVADGVPANGTIVGSFYPGQTIPINAAIVPSTTFQSPIALGVIFPLRVPPYMYPATINVFRNWTSGGGGTFADASSPSTTFTMPDDNVTVTANPQFAYKLWTSGAHIVNPLDTTSMTWQLGYYLPGTAVLLGSNVAASFGSGWTFRGWMESLTAPDGTTLIPGGGDFSNPMSSTTTYTMPAANSIVQAPWDPDPDYASKLLIYTLTVLNGTGAIGAGTSAGIIAGIRAGTGIRLVADPPPAGYEFVGWRINNPVPAPGYPGAFLDISNPSTQFIMAEGNITIEAVYDVRKYVLAVVNGIAVTGEGPYAPGEKVEIVADSPSAVSEFSHWTAAQTPLLRSLSGSFDDNTLPETTVTMPANHVTVTANYTQVIFELTVEAGLGSGEYRRGDLVVINAVAPPGLVFDHWEVRRGGAVIDRIGRANTFLRMPGRDATVRAIFKNASTKGDEDQKTGNDTAGSPGSTDSAATGDSANITGWTASMILSAVGLICIFICALRRRQLLALPQTILNSLKQLYRL